MILVAWIGLCLIVALLLRNRPAVSIALAMALWTFIPGVVVGHITGHTSGSLSMHLASWLVLATFLAQVLTDPRALGEALVRRFFVYITILLVIAAAVLETKSGDAQHGVVFAADEMAIPFLAFWVLSAAINRDVSEAYLLRNVLIVLAVGESAFAIAQYATDSVIVYHSYYTEKYWFTAGWHRWMGTTDHPLVLSMLICAAIPFVAGLKRRWLQPVVLVVMLIALVITQSRAGVIAGAIATIYVVLASRTTALRKVVSVAVMGVAALVIATSSLSTGIVDRINNDSGSALARGSAWGYFADHWSHYLLTGGGISANYQVAINAGLDTSFESAFLMYSVDLGILLTVAYFLAQLVAVLRGSPARLPGSRLAAILVLALVQTFNSLEVETLVGLLVWLVITLATVPAHAPNQDEADRRVVVPRSRAALSPV